MYVLVKVGVTDEERWQILCGWERSRNGAVTKRMGTMAVTTRAAGKRCYSFVGLI